MDSYTLIKNGAKYGRIASEVLMMKTQDPNWEQLLKENFELSGLQMMDILKDTSEWVDSWLHPKAVTNTPLHRKRKQYGEHE